MKKSSMLKIISLLTLSLALSGCGGSSMQYWYNAQKDFTGAKNDKFQCEEAAAAYSRNIDMAGDKEVMKKRMKECMEARGYLYLNEDEIPKGAPKLQ